MCNSSDTASTRERILKATLKLIGNEGFHSITIKKIADLADVNIAAVNYYFGSKSNVINEAMKVLSQKLVKAFDVLEKKELPPIERLRAFLLSYTKGAMEYPDVFRVYVYRIISNNEDHWDYFDFIKKEGIDKIKNILVEIGVTTDNEILTMKLMQMVSSLGLPVLLGNAMEQLSGISYENEETRRKYIELIINSLLA